MNRRSTVLTRERIKLGDDAFAEVRIIHVVVPVPGSMHHYKYGLAYVVSGECLLRYDNEAGKGDHKHVGAHELPYIFTSLEALIDDFWDDVAQL